MITGGFKRGQGGHGTRPHTFGSQKWARTEEQKKKN